MVKPLFILKLGGSIITYKNHPTGKLRLKRLLEIVQEIKQAKKRQDFNLILVNGAGSYGHPIAKKYNTANGIKTKVQLRGFCEIKHIVNYLSTQLNKIFLTAGLDVFSCQTSSLITQSKGKISLFNMAPIKQLLNLGLIPTLSGDVVTDTSWGGSICSGDAIAPYLAKKIETRKVLFASDVDGVFNQNPQKHKGAKLIPEINRRNFPKIIGLAKESLCADVTGGMKGKLLKIERHYKKTKIMIFGGLRKNSVFEALSGKKLGTLIDLT